MSANSTTGELLVLLESSQELICLTRPDGRFEWLNPRWTEVLGWPMKDMQGRALMEIVHPADIGPTTTKLARLSKGQRTVQFETRCSCVDGRWRRICWNATQRDDGMLFCIARDVTERYNAEREQRARIRQLELAESLSRVGNWRVDLTNNEVHWSPEVFRIHGRDPETFRPDLETAIEAYHPADRDEVRRHLKEAIETRGSFSFQLRLIRADDYTQRTVLGSGVVQLDEEGEPAEIIGVFQDITRTAQTEQELREANTALERRMVDLETRSAAIEWVAELGDMLQSALDMEESREVLRALLPRIFTGLSGIVYLRSEESGAQMRVASWGELGGDWRSADPSTCWSVRRGIPHSVSDGGPLRCRHFGSDVRTASRCMPLMAHGQLVGLLVLINEQYGDNRLDTLGSLCSMVSEQIALAVSNVRLRDRLRQQSLRDQLTGLYNRRFFDDWLSKQLSQARRRNSSVGVAIIDLDHFKRFNDTFGHLTADRVLVGFASTLQESIRDEDVVCRWGGEEFLVALPGVSSEQIVMVIGRIQESLSRLEIRDAEGVRISPPTLSAGVAIYPKHASQKELLLTEADRALYEAKNGGRNRCCIATKKVLTVSEGAAQSSGAIVDLVG